MSRVKNLVERYSSEVVKQALAVKDPSRNGKYLEWIIKAQETTTLALSRAGCNDAIAGVVEFFHTNQNRMARKDIYAYTLSELTAEIDALGKSKHSIKKEAKDNTEKVYEDDNWLAMYIPERAGMMQYGRETKWCVTSKGETYFEDYVVEGARFYVVISKKNPADKYCIFFEAGDDNLTPLAACGQVWNALNTELSHKAVTKAWDCGPSGKGRALTDTIMIHVIHTHTPMLQKYNMGVIEIEELIVWLVNQHPLTISYAFQNFKSLERVMYSKREKNVVLCKKVANLIVGYCSHPAAEDWAGFDDKDYKKISFKEFSPLVAQLVVKELTERKINPIPWTLAFNFPAEYLPPFLLSTNPKVRRHCAWKICKSSRLKNEYIPRFLADKDKEIVLAALSKATRSQKMKAVADKVQHATFIRYHCPKDWWAKKAKKAKKPNKQSGTQKQLTALRKEVRGYRAKLNKLLAA
jgi:hypothetical protein